MWGRKASTYRTANKFPCIGLIYEKKADYLRVRSFLSLQVQEEGSYVRIVDEKISRDHFNHNLLLMKKLTEKDDERLKTNIF